MIITNIKMTVPAEKRKEILQTIQAVTSSIRREHGCISCNCYVNLENENGMFFMEEWQTSKDFENHLKSNLFGVLIGAIELLGELPDVKFNTIASIAGQEAITMARASDKIKG